MHNTSTKAICTTCGRSLALTRLARLPFDSVILAAARSCFAQCSYPLRSKTMQNLSKCQLSFVCRILSSSSTWVTLDDLASTSVRSTAVSLREYAISGSMFFTIILVRSVWWKPPKALRRSSSIVILEEHPSEVMEYLRYIYSSQLSQHTYKLHNSIHYEMKPR